MECYADTGTAAGRQVSRVHLAHGPCMVLINMICVLNQNIPKWTYSSVVAQA